MDFLRRLFSSAKQPVTPNFQVQLSHGPLAKVHKVQISTGLPYHSKIIAQSSSFQRQLKQSSILNQIQTKFLYVYQLSKKQLISSPDFGVLVGVIGRQIYYQNILDNCNVVKVGNSQQINSLRALRKKSLDSLVVFFNQTGCQFGLEQIIHAQQRLILVVQQQAEIQTQVTNIQKILCQIFQERPLTQCLQYLCFSVIAQDKKYYLEFKQSNYFLEYFRDFLKKIKIQFQDDDQFLHLVKMIKFKDYLDFRKLNESAISKILTLKEKFLREVQDEKRKEEIKKLGSLLSQSENQDDEQLIIEPVRKESSIQADMEAEYFKRISDKKTTQINNDEQIQSADLLYFIEERDNTESQDNQRDTSCKNSPQNRIRIEKKKGHTKSQHAFESEREEDLDQQFFNKY